jgi:hypothetical protein
MWVGPMIGAVLGAFTAQFLQAASPEKNVRSDQ